MTLLHLHEFLLQTLIEALGVAGVYAVFGDAAHRTGNGLEVGFILSSLALCPFEFAAITENGVGEGQHVVQVPNIEQRQFVGGF